MSGRSSSNRFDVYNSREERERTIWVRNTQANAPINEHLLSETHLIDNFHQIVDAAIHTDVSSSPKMFGY